MKITALVENVSNCELTPKHGISFYIQTEKHNLLFDLGPDETLFENAKKRGIDLAEIDTVIISHGHADHGGAMERFLQINKKAKIYVQRRAFERHTCKLLFLKFYVGLNRKLQNHPQIVLVDGDEMIDEELSLFVVKETGVYHSTANDILYEGRQKDNFLHEQNLLIREKTTAIIAGCGHAGIVNIMQRSAAFAPAYCIGGYHLYDPVRKRTVDESLLAQIADCLSAYDKVEFYTCHCTGKTAFDFLSARLPNMHYFSCGDQLELG